VTAEGRPEVTPVVKLMGGSLPIRRIIQALSGLSSRDAKLVADLVSRLTAKAN